MGRGQGQKQGHVATRGGISIGELELDKTYFLKMTTPSEDYATRFVAHIRNPRPSMATTTQVAELWGSWTEANKDLFTDAWTDGATVYGLVEVFDENDIRGARACLDTATAMDFPVEVELVQPNDVDPMESLRNAVSEDIVFPVTDDDLKPRRESFEETSMPLSALLSSSDLATKAAQVAELHAALEIAYDSLPDHQIGEELDSFDAMLKLTSDAGLDLKPGPTSEAITQLLWFALSSDGLDGAQRTRLVASLALLNS